MQLFFWFSITLLAFASFTYLSIPIFLRPAVDESSATHKKTVLLSLFLVPVFLAITSIGIYSYIGQPAMLSAPIKPEIDNKYADIIKQIETHLAKNPEDAEGWQVVAPTYLSLSQPEKAFEAYANAIKFGNSNGKNWLGLGKSNLIINKGVFGPMTKVAFTKANEKSPDDIEAMYFYATMLQNNAEADKAKSAIDNFISSHDFSAQQLLPLTQILDTIKQIKVSE